MKVGDKIKRKIEYGAEYGSNLPPEEGTVVCIHPKRRFFVVEFDFPKGKIRESYPMKNKITNPTYEPGRKSYGPWLPGDKRKKEVRKGKYLNHI